MKIFYLFIFCISFISSSLSQTHRFDFAKSYASLQFVQVKKTTTDSSGNFYSIGEFRGTQDFDSSSDTFNLTSYGVADVFILKHNADSSFAWCKKIGAPQGSINNNSYAHIHDIEIDPTNNFLYVSGEYKDSVDFNPDINLQEIRNSHSSNIPDGFICKFNLNGNFQWVKMIINNSPSNQYSSNILIKDLTISHDNFIYFIGEFNDTLDFSDFNSNQFLVSKGLIDGCISKLTNDGDLVWAKQIGGNGEDRFNKIVIDNDGNLITSGMYNGIADLNPDPNIDSNIFSVLNIDCFIEKLDTAGQLIWLKTYINNNGNFTPSTSSNSYISIYDIAIDYSNNIVIVGNVFDTIDFDFSSNTVLSLDINKSAFIHKISQNGNHLWFSRFGGNEYNEWWTDVVIDSLNNIYSFGQFYNHSSNIPPLIDFNSSNGIAYLAPPQEFDSYILKLSENGEYIWVKKIGGELNVKSYDLHIHHEYLYLSGTHKSNSDLNPDEEVELHGELGTNNAFIIRLKTCSNTIYVDTTITACNYYISGDGVTFTSNQNDVNYILSASNNCDSVVKTNIIINYIDTTVTIESNNILSSNEDNADNYTWYDCTWNYTEIPNENNQSITANYPGHYAVIVSNSQCTDTSACIYMDLSGIDELHNNYYSISPNPSNGTFIITNDNYSKTSFRVVNFLGEEVSPLQEFNSKKFALYLNEPRGVYFVELFNSETKKTIRIIIN